MTAARSGPAFSVHDIPFSAYGSWFDISPVVAEKTYAEDLHLVSHQNGMHGVLRLVPLDAASGERAVTRVEATPDLLTWTGGSGRVELAYETPDTVRLRGSGPGLGVLAAARTLTPFSGTYFFHDPAADAHVFTSYETGRRYRVTLLSGALAGTAGTQALGSAERGVTVTAAADGHWEIAIEELDAARPPYAPSAPFDAVVASARAAFADFVDAVAPWRSAATPAAELAAYVVWSATVAAKGLVTRPGVLMSKHWMDKVWSWDHCFNALALAGGSPELARDQFHLPFDHQDASGALPDSVTHSEVLYNFVKPPIHGWAYGRLRRTLPSPPDRTELTEVYERLERWTGFWLTARRAPGADLPYYQHGNDSGWDNATTFDPERVVVTADLAAFLTLQLHELASLAEELGETDEAARWTRTAEEMQTALLDQLWTGDRFVARSAGTGDTWSSAGLLDLMPIALGEHLPAEVAGTLADHIKAHLTPYGLATELPTSPHYLADGYWRGPIWAPATVLVEDGLRRAGHQRLADDISARFRALCEAHGFAENFDALTGTGLRDRAYTWTASSYLLLARDHHLREQAGTGEPVV
ncbi:MULTISPECIES: amylo-alpha-1,6-glucosidase [Streptomyces]|uniref:Mannosylglycerate hydrolase MGH1-like glycoside hydrolase domain-containing protein n=1 Tax=Streptomyces scabiei (strain 87.22) TaxID=680198 RepID=C9YSX9_STRSW|nr:MULTISPECIES: trehalase family glycosidase [Streptomyces]MBP5859392.1 glycogen debranching protein [Streptomyces sp. LBUM 1484]MBP5871943.1 glycogen debranching protein [Streptomyces sp. LBUM 1485]MBP5934521.1 glycogen debranching protein [Streptomyces sp. LBUM 1479]KFG08615.1 glycogen debranching protein [Streptomyces scabiei]MBP5880460.1 glycogen debranching protein [Streptomyces sp. LBUM 1477]